MARARGCHRRRSRRIWRAFGLQPHRVEHWKLSKDPLFVDKVRDIVGLYLDPPERALVLCVDEKSQIQALDRTAPTLPMLPGTPARATHDYKRNGTSSLFAALEIALGQGDRVAALPPPRGRVQEVPAQARSTRSRRTRGAPDPRQLRRPTRPPRSSAGCSPTRASSSTSRRPALAGSTWSSAGSPSSPARKLKRGSHRTVRELNADIRDWIETLEREPPPLRLDQDRRPDPRNHRLILQTN